MKFKDKIIEWLYINDNKFPNKNEWRENFIDFLTELENKQPSEYQIGYDPANVTEFGHAILIKPIRCGNKIIYEINNTWSESKEKCEPNSHNPFVDFFINYDPTVEILERIRKEEERKLKTEGNVECKKRKMGFKF